MKMYGLQWQADTLYLCLEIDQFPAQAVSAYNHTYKDKPFIVVRQDAESHKSLAFACSPRARKMDINPGTPVQHIKKMYRNLEVVCRDREVEIKVCKELESIINTFTPEFEMKDNGFCLLNLSHTPIKGLLPARDIAVKLKNEILNKVDLQEAAVGISQSKLIARVLAKMAKPDDIKICEPGEEQVVISFLDCRFLHGLSPSCREKLRKYGLKKIGQVQQLEREALVKRFGMEGEKLFKMVRGIDLITKAPHPGVLQAETVFKKDITHLQTIARYIRHTVDKLCHQLIAQCLLIDKFTFILKYTDHKTVQKSTSLPAATNELPMIMKRAAQLFESLYQRRVGIKSVKITAKKPMRSAGQLGLFDTERERKGRRFWDGITRVRSKLHFNTLFSAGELGIITPAKGGNIMEKPFSGFNRKFFLKFLAPPPDLTGKHIFVGTSGCLNLHNSVKLDGSERNRTRSKKEGKKEESARDYLKLYQKYFSFAEIQHTFFHEPKISDFVRIERNSKDSMIYAVKVHKSIAQPKIIDIAAGKELMRKHISAVSPLVETGRFYSFLIQLDDEETRSREMLDYLIRVANEAVQQHIDVHIEFRHISWEMEFVLNALKDNGVGICNTEFPGFSQIFPLTAYATTDKGLIRYHGRKSGSGRHSDYFYSEREIRQRIPGQIGLSEKVSTLAIVYNNNPQAAALKNAVRNIQLLKPKLYLN